MSEKEETIKTAKLVMEKIFDPVKIRLDKQDFKIAKLETERKLKINYMMKMNQLEKNDKTHQALYEKLIEKTKDNGSNIADETLRLDFRIDVREKEIKKLEKQIQGLHNKQVGHIDIEHKKIINKELSELKAIEKVILGTIEVISKDYKELKEKFKKVSHLRLHNAIIKNRDVLQGFLELFEETHDDSINRESFTILLKRLSGATDVRSAAHTEKPSYGCFLFTYCSECIVAFDDCKRKGIQQVVVKKEDLKELDSTLSNERFESPDTIESIIRMGQAWDKFKEKYLGGKEG